MTKLDILYQDDDLIFIDKPAGLLTIPDRFAPEKINLKDLLKQKFGEIFTVHRLDKDTSGVICFAKTEEAHRSLSLQFEKRSTRKQYLAIVEGRIHKESDRIDQPIAKHLSKPGKMVVSKKGKAAITEYQLLESFKHFSLVQANILTGRTHQIRVHFAFIGHPLAIDPLYGKREAFFLSEIKGRRYNLGKDQEERPLVSRLSLHAHSLTLQHPTTGEEMTIQAEVPKDLRAMINQLRKWDV